MNPVISQLNGVLAPGQYVPGHYAWNYAVRLTGAAGVCHLPDAGVVTIGLEVGGVLTGSAFIFSRNQKDVRRAGPANLQNLALNALVPANTVVRWKVVAFTGALGDAATEGAITLSAVAQSLAQATALPPVFTVGWVNGAERLTLFNYDATARTFTETVAGISSGRAAVMKTGDTSLSISIEGTPALTMAAGVLSVNSITARGSAVSRVSPRLEFLVNNLRVGTLTPDGLVIPRVVEATPGGAPSPNNRFEFWSSGSITAALDQSALTAADLQAPI